MEAAQPERQQRGEQHERGAAERDHRAHPVVEAPVRDAHAGQVGDAARDAAGELAPAARQHQLVGDPAGHQHQRGEGDDRDDRGDRAPPALELPGAEHRGDGEHPDEQDRPAAAGLGRLRASTSNAARPTPASATNAIARATATGSSVAPVAARIAGLTGAERCVVAMSSSRPGADGGGDSVALTGGGLV